MFSVMVTISYPSQSSHPRLSFVHMMGQFCPRVRVTLARLRILPPPRLVLVVRVIFLVLNAKPLCFVYERPLLAFREQTTADKYRYL